MAGIPLLDGVRNDLEYAITYPFSVGYIWIVLGGVAALGGSIVAQYSGGDVLTAWHIFSPLGSSFGEFGRLSGMLGEETLLVSVVLDGQFWVLPGIVHAIGLLLCGVGIGLVLWATLR
ncbi:hypothetical protein [Saliphagus sp. LR7]|uniref:hypothetical protein n=1 Tax=Saliphagus sp. LR7 TaxID=2282654 RepID=UPI000DF7598F|nr:hypothetical protein [Saliphagus sp. LR7]